VISNIQTSAESKLLQSFFCCKPQELRYKRLAAVS
jgi:hypothetical protein